MSRGAVLVVLGLGCTTDSLDWTIAFADPADHDRARGIRLAVAPGGCPPASEPIYRADVRRGRPIPETGALAPGQYAFSADAYDSMCTRIAGVCDPVTLPRDAPLVSTLVSVSPAPCDGCPASFCESLRTADAGVPSGDSCGESCTCDYDDVCEFSCPVGTSCTLRCRHGSTCTFACPGSDCTILCEDASCAFDSCGTGGRCSASGFATLVCGATCGEVRP